MVIFPVSDDLTEEMLQNIKEVLRGTIARVRALGENPPWEDA